MPTSRNSKTVVLSAQEARSLFCNGKQDKPKLSKAKANKTTAKDKHKIFDLKEHRIQTDCITWFRLQYPAYKHNLFAVPNGGLRDKITAAQLMDEGVLAGVADLILLKSNDRYGALLIEMKTRTGRQSDNQIEWQQKIEADGYRYVICRSIEDFMREVREYLSTVPSY